MIDTSKGPKTPLVTVTGPIDGNVFSVIAVVARQLRREGHREAEAEFKQRVALTGGEAQSYDDVLCIAQQYADFDI
jgi:hypothetical protein